MQEAHQREFDGSSRALDVCADAALSRARQLGVGHAAVRRQRVETEVLTVRDGTPEARRQSVEAGASVVVLLDGVPGFAADSELSTTTMARLAERAVNLARIRGLAAEHRVQLAHEPVHQARWSSNCAIDPFNVPLGEKLAVLEQWSHRLLGRPPVRHVTASVKITRENRLYADSAGTRTWQLRTTVVPQVVAFAEGAPGTCTSMRTLAPPSARGWEYLLGAGWNWNEEIDQILELLREQLQAPSAIPGCYDLVIDPSHLWLVVHESVGHALEFDRMLGHEAAFAGTSYLPADSISSFQLGSELMTVIADRTSPNGLATIGFDDEGVSAQSWLIVNSGRVVGTMVDRVTAALAGMERSNGCSAAASPFHQPVVRMPNISIAPAADPTTTTDLIAGVDRGMYVVGDSSWSIDMQRQQFRFSPQRCHLIRNGRLDGQVREMAYEGSTVPFWHSLAALGGPGTYQVFGTDRCGKAQPLQIGAVSHGCPSALFRAVAVGDTRRVNGWRT